MKQKHLELKKKKGKKRSLFKSTVLVFVLNKKTQGLNALLLQTVVTHMNSV